ncbi:MAG: translation initiation factor 3 [Roseovarius sp.]|uniref:translation initiation factor 3 n=1 Tax=Roseovarius sp. TaxID=1486281 RepID=UPI00405890A7
MKNLVWIVVAVAVLGGGYLLITGKSVTDVIEEVSQGKVETPVALKEAETAVGDAAETVTKAAQEAAEAAGDAAGKAVEATENAASDAAEAVTATATDTVNAAKDAVEAVTGATDAAGDGGATDPAETTGEAADGATDPAGATTGTTNGTADATTDTGGEAAEAGAVPVNGATDPAADAVPEKSTESLPDPEAQDAPGAQDTGTTPDALTAEGFDMERALSLIEGADLGAMQKSQLIEGIKAAQDNPDLLRGALEAAREALGY